MTILRYLFILGPISLQIVVLLFPPPPAPLTIKAPPPTPDYKRTWLHNVSWRDRLKKRIINHSLLQSHTLHPFTVSHWPQHIRERCSGSLIGADHGRRCWSRLSLVQMLISSVIGHSDMCECPPPFCPKFPHVMEFSYWVHWVYSRGDDVGYQHSRISTDLTQYKYEYMPYLHQRLEPNNQKINVYLTNI